MLVGVLAHLVERDIRIVEVRSSSLLHSTIIDLVVENSRKLEFFGGK